MKSVIFYSLFLASICFLPYSNSIAATIEHYEKLSSKEQKNNERHDKSYFPGFGPDQSMALCLERCKKKSQMAAMGYEAIMETCRHQCDLEKATSMIKSHDAETKYEGTKLLCQLGEKSTVPLLITLLQEDMENRTGAWADIIPALGDMRDIRATEILIDLVALTDDDWLGREMAAYALGQIGNTKATPVLIKAAWRADTREAAIIALAKLRDPQTAATLVSAIQPNEDKSARDAARVGLIQLKSEAVPLINEEFKNYSRENKQTQKRVWLCDILGTIATEEARRALRKSLDDQDPAVKKCAEKYF